MKSNLEHYRLLVDGIGYRQTGEVYAQALLDGPVPTLKDILKVRKGAYDHVIYDSDVEKRFAEDLEKNTAVKVYAKLPGWFRVPTPLGDYNPDWAILLQVEEREKLCFVAETKSTLWTGALRETEHQKIACGRQHFTALIADPSSGPLQYEVVSSLDDVFKHLP